MKANRIHRFTIHVFKTDLFLITSGYHPCVTCSYFCVNTGEIIDTGVYGENWYKWKSFPSDCRSWNNLYIKSHIRTSLETSHVKLALDDHTFRGCTETCLQQITTSATETKVDDFTKTTQQIARKPGGRIFTILVQIWIRMADQGIFFNHLLQH